MVSLIPSDALRWFITETRKCNRISTAMVDEISELTVGPAARFTVSEAGARNSLPELGRMRRCAAPALAVLLEVRAEEPDPIRRVDLDGAIEMLQFMLPG